jgi:hypothetical protein
MLTVAVRAGPELAETVMPTGPVPAPAVLESEIQALFSDAVQPQLPPLAVTVTV